jgi:hypothetical protein
MSFPSDVQRRAAYAKKGQAKRVPLRKRISAGQSEVNAQIEHDAWLLSQWRRRDPAAYKELVDGLPYARTDLRSHESWSPDEHEDTALLIKAADEGLVRYAHTLPTQAGGRLLEEIRNRDDVLAQRKRAAYLPPARLLKELEDIERSLRWTPLWDRSQRRRNRLLLSATRREAYRRGILKREDA